MDKLSKEEVLHVANLARLNVKEEEIEKYSKQLSDILTEIDKITSVDIDEEGEVLISAYFTYKCL
jgi:aspartyl-tRNA(Asn)/glutamyl-tRNA(Gln) amidotransferase subunit C